MIYFNETSDMETQYKAILSKSLKTNTHHNTSLLPIKTEHGLVEMKVYKEASSNSNIIEDKSIKNSLLDRGTNLQCSLAGISNLATTIQLLAVREEELNLFRCNIGLLSSEIIANPEEKINNLAILLNLMDKRNQAGCITTRKLVIASVLEIFNDLIPNYTIRSRTKDVKLKKETLRLQDYETSILKYFKQYLQKLEKYAMSVNVSEQKKCIPYSRKQDLILGIFAFDCLTNLLVTHPNFNFSSNIANFLVPHLDHEYKYIRQRIADSLMQLFKEDNCGEISLIVMRRLNRYIKSRKNLRNYELVSILLELRINRMSYMYKNNGDAPKLISFKNKALVISKNKNRSINEINRIEKEMLETKAEERKRNHKMFYTEITNLLFLIYFRILKETPRKRILSYCLKGLSKFSDCINSKFYQDLFNILDDIIRSRDLSLRDQLYCIHTSFIILFDQYSSFNVDHNKFYEYLHQISMDIHIGSSHDIIEVMTEILKMIFLKHKTTTRNRLLALIKTISELTLHSQHSVALELIHMIKLIIKNRELSEISLDYNCCKRDNTYYAQVENPEYCDRNSTSSWGIIALQRHYHSIVRNVSARLMSGRPLREDRSNLSSKNVSSQKNPLDGLFEPNIPIPKKNIAKISYEYTSKYKFYESNCIIETVNILENL